MRYFTRFTRFTRLVRKFWVWLFTPYPRPVSPDPLVTCRQTRYYVPVFRYLRLQGGRLCWETSILGDVTPSHAQAKRAGLKARGSDDFNILVIENGEVVKVLWMTSDIHEHPDVMDECTDELRRQGVLP